MTAALRPARPLDRTPAAGRLGVLQVVDTLAAGGAERMAVNLANHLPRDRFAPQLCSTRAEGPLAALVHPDVPRLRLARRHRFDLPPLLRLARHVRHHGIRVLHAHGDALFTALAVRARDPRVRVVWHDHYGRDLQARAVLPYRCAMPAVSAVIAVNESLAAWAVERAGAPAARVRYVANFVEPAEGATPPPLPGVPGLRVACVANLRPQKDHAMLLDAFARVVRQVPGAHLLLVGAAPDVGAGRALHQAIAARALAPAVTWLGGRDDVPAVLAGCAVGVLSSRSEGLPLALLEYGAAGLAVAATAVGQCPDVLDDGRAGLLVPPGDAAALADALTALLADDGRRRTLGRALSARVAARFGAAPALAAVAAAYDAAIA